MKIELTKKLLTHWKKVVKTEKSNEEENKEKYERGIRRKKGLEKFEKHFKQISEEVERIEEEKADEEKLEEVIDGLKREIEKNGIEYELEYRQRGERDYKSFWENVWFVVSIVKYEEDSLESLKEMEIRMEEMEDVYYYELEDDKLVEERIDQEKGERSLENMERNGEFSELRR